MPPLNIPSTSSTVLRAQVTFENEKIREVPSFKSARIPPLHEPHRHHPGPSTDGEIAQCEHVFAERAVAKHHTDEGHEESVALRLKTNCHSPYESAGEQTKLLL
jgi:hypothetical protein